MRITAPGWWYNNIYIYIYNELRAQNPHSDNISLNETLYRDTIIWRTASAAAVSKH